MKKTARSIAEKYCFTNKLSEIDALEAEPLPLHLGFLGEFSSGKSTLINALIGKKVLPAMDRPTSRSIVEVHPKKGLEKTEFYEIKGNLIEPITPVVFQDISNGKIDGRAMLCVPENQYFHEGWIFVDTPGLASLDQTDMDITYGYLPRLDSVVLCIDIAQGSLTNSILDFLSKKEVRPFINNFIVAITHADTKSEDHQQKIKQNIIEQINTFSMKHKIPTDNLSQKIVLVSGKNALDKNSQAPISDFLKALEEQILAQKILMQNQRKQKVFLSISEDLVVLLEDRLENLSFDSSELVEKEKALKADSLRLNSDINKSKALLDETKSTLRKELLNTAEQAAAHYQSATSQEAVSSASKKVAADFQEIISSCTNRYFKDLALEKTPVSCGALEREIQKIIKFSDISKTLFTAAAFAAISGGTSFAANAGEAAGGAAARSLAKQATIEGARYTATKIAQNKAVSTLSILGKVFKDINPIEHIGDYIAGKFIKGKANDHLQRIALNTADNVHSTLAHEIDHKIINPVKIKIDEIQASIDVVKAEKSDKQKDFTGEKQILKNDITILKSKIIQAS